MLFLMWNLLLYPILFDISFSHIISLSPEAIGFIPIGFVFLYFLTRFVRLLYFNRLLLFIGLTLYLYIGRSGSLRLIETEERFASHKAPTKSTKDLELRRICFSKNYLNTATNLGCFSRLF